MYDNGIGTLNYYTNYVEDNTVLVHGGGLS